MGSSNNTSNGNGDSDDSAMDSPAPTDTQISDAPFADGERVLAYHTGRLYEARVRKVDYKEDRWVFHVHYLGWKKSWDEWVGIERLMKHTEENMQKKKALDEKDGNDKSAKINRGSHNKPKAASNVTRGRKRKNESGIKDKNAVLPDKLVTIQIPSTLKKQLIDDCDFITHLGKHIQLPRKPTVNDILKKYFDYRLKKCGSMSDSVEEIMKGLCCYFDKALPAMLLYKNERKQYQEACPSDITPSSVYGAEHLLRLFVKLPELLFHASIDEATLIELQAQLAEFLRFLQKNQSTFFLSTYHVPEDIENSSNKLGD